MCYTYGIQPLLTNYHTVNTLIQSIVIRHLDFGDALLSCFHPGPVLCLLSRASTVMLLKLVMPCHFTAENLQMAPHCIWVYATFLAVTFSVLPDLWLRLPLARYTSRSSPDTSSTMIAKDGRAVQAVRVVHYPIVESITHFRNHYRYAYWRPVLSSAKEEFYKRKSLWTNKADSILGFCKFSLVLKFSLFPPLYIWETPSPLVYLFKW